MINNIFHKMNRAIVPTICILLIGSGIVFLYISLIPINVLKDWRISVPPGTYGVGDPIVLTSSSIKQKNVQGEATRYVQCENIKYLFSQSTGKRKVGTVKSELRFRIPNNIANLPTQCRIGIDVTYTFWHVRKVHEHTMSNYFTVQ